MTYVNDLDLILDYGDYNPEPNPTKKVNNAPNTSDEKKMSKIFLLADQLKAAKEKKKALEDEVKAITAEIDRLDLALSDEMAMSECDNFSRHGSTFISKADFTLLRKQAVKINCSLHFVKTATAVWYRKMSMQTRCHLSLRSRKRTIKILSPNGFPVW